MTMPPNGDPSDVDWPCVAIKQQEVIERLMQANDNLTEIANEAVENSRLVGTKARKIVATLSAENARLRLEVIRLQHGHST